MPDHLPTGFHFTPTHKELIHPFLTEISKSEGKRSPNPWAVVNKNVYGENSAPWQILTDTDPWFPVVVGGKVSLTKKVIYVYTQKSYVCKNRKNVKRKAGSGCWSGENKGKDIFRIDNGIMNVIGNYKLLTYKADGISTKADMDASNARYGHWIMHEYSLAGIYGSSDFVLCEITKDDENRMMTFQITPVLPLEPVPRDHESENAKKKEKVIDSTDNYTVQAATLIPQQYSFVHVDHRASTSTAALLEEFQNNNMMPPLESSLEMPRVNVQGYDARECCYNYETLHGIGAPQDNLEVDLSEFNDLLTTEVDLSEFEDLFTTEEMNGLMSFYNPINDDCKKS